MLPKTFCKEASKCQSPTKEQVTERLIFLFCFVLFVWVFVFFFFFFWALFVVYVSFLVRG